MSKSSSTPDPTLHESVPPSTETGMSDDPFEWVKLAPTDEERWDAVDEAAREVDSPDDAEATYQNVLDSTTDAETLSLVGRRAIEFLEEWYEDTDHSIAILQRLIGRDYDNAWALEKLSLLLTLSERWDDLLGTYDAALAHLSEPAKQIPLLEEAARIAKDFAGQAQRASDYLKQLLLIRPNDAKLAASLERRLLQQQRHQDLVDIWTARLSVVDTPTELDLRIRISSTQLEELAQPELAIESTKALLDSGIGEEQACSLLEKLSGAEKASLETQRESLDILRQRYGKADRPLDVINVLQRALDLAPDDGARILTNQRLVTWLLQVGQQSEALQACSRWLRLSPGAEDALEQLRALSSATGEYGNFADALVHAAETAPTAKLRVNLVLEAAEAQEEQAKDPDAATTLFARVLLDPDSGAEGKLRAARRLTGLLINDTQAGQRLDVLEKLASLEPEGATQVDLLGEAAALAEKLGDDNRALRLWDGRLAQRAADKTALDAKVLILARCERFELLQETLLTRFESSEDNDERRQDLVRIAEIDNDRLDRPQAAIQSWRRVEAVFGSNEETVDALSRLLSVELRWEELIELLNTAIGQEDDVARKTDHYTTLGQTYSAERGEFTRAVSEYKKALELDPKFEAARDGLRSLLAAEETQHSAAETLATAFQAADEWELLLEIAETRLSAEPNPTSRQAILLESADLLETRATNVADALAYVERAFSIYPQASIEEKMIGLADRTGSWDVVVTGYQRALRHCDSLERTTELLLEQGRTLENKLSSDSEALAAYRRIVELEPTHLPAANAVVRCGGRLGDWTSAAWALLRSAGGHGLVETTLIDEWQGAAESAGAWDNALQAVHDALNNSGSEPSESDASPLVAEVAHHVKHQLAKWHRDRREDPAAAESILAEAVEQHQAVDSLSMLCQLRRRHPDPTLVQSLLKLADVIDDSLPSLDEASRVALDVVKDTALAKPIVHRTLDLAESRLAETKNDSNLAITSWCLTRLVELYRSAGEAQTAFELLGRGATMNFEPELILELKHQAAEVASTQLESPSQAIVLCREILERSPSRKETINLLAALYEQQKQLPDLLELRQHELKLDPDLGRRLELRLDIARVLGALNKPNAQRIDQLRTNLEEQAGHLESIDALADIFTPLDQHQELYELLCGQASILKRNALSTEAAKLYARGGHLAEHVLQQLDAAIEAYELAIGLEPEVGVLDALADIHSERKDFNAAVQWLDQRLQLTGASKLDEKRQALVRLGIALREAGDETRAVAELHAGLTQDPGAQTVRELLATLHETREEWRPFADLLSDGVEFAPDEATKIRYLMRSADVRWHELDELATATPLLKAALALSPNDKGLRLTLADALRRGAHYADAKELLDGLLAEFGRRRTPERATVHFQLAQIARSTGELAESLTQLDAASKIQRSNPLVLKTLGDVARENNELERAERAYRALLLLVGRSDGPGRSLQSDENAQSEIGASSILFELYRIATELKDEERAKDLLDSAIEAADEDPVEALKLEHALEQAGQWPLLLDALQRRASTATKSADILSLNRTRARAFSALERHDEALALSLEMLSESPGDQALLIQTSGIATACDQQSVFQTKISDIAKAKQSDNPALSCQIWLQMGELSEQSGDTAEAIKYYQEAQLSGAQPKLAFDTLARLLEGQAEPAALALALKRFLGSPEGSLEETDITSALYRAAEIETQNLDSLESGIDYLQRALARGAAQEASQQASKILRASIDAVGAQASTLKLLESVARDAKDRQMLLDALVLLSESEFSTLKRLKEGVTLAKELESKPQQLALLECTVTFALQNNTQKKALWAFTELAMHHQEQGAFEKAASLLEVSVEHCKAKERFELTLSLANLHNDQLKSPAAAAPLYESLAADAPGDSRIWQPLLELYRATDERDKLEASLSRAEEHVTEAGLKLDLQLERVRLMIDSERFDEAESTLRQLMSETPSKESIGDLLLTLLDRQERQDDIRELLQDRLDYAISSGHESMVISSASRLGSLLEDQDDEAAAVEIYRTARNAVTRSRVLLSALLRLVPDTEENERADLMESLLPTEATEAVEGVALQLAGLRSSIGDETGLERALELGFKLSPESYQLRTRLHDWYREREDWLPLAELMTSDAASTEDTNEALTRFQAAAELYEEKLGDAVSAAGVLKQALERDPCSPQILERFSQYQLTAGDGDQAIDAIASALATDGLEGSTQAVLYHLRAAVRARADGHSLRSVSLAVADLDSAASLGGSEVDDDLGALLLRQRELAEAEGSTETEAEVMHRLATFLPKHDRASEALELLAQWVRRNEDELDGLRTWAKLSLELSAWQDSMEAHRLLFARESGELRRVAALQFAEACEHAGAAMDAKAILDEARREFPTDAEIGERVFRMYDSSGAHDELARILLAEAEASTDPEHQYTLFTNAGALLLRTVEPQPEGILAYQKAIELRPNDHTAKVGLANSYTRGGQIAEACEVLEASIKQHGKRRSRQLSELQHAMANVAEAAGDEDGRFAWLDAALQSDRKNGDVAAELAIFAMDRGEYDAAIKALQLVTLLKETSPMSRAEAYLRQGIIAQERGDKKKALLLGKRAYNADGGYEPAQQFLDQLSAS